MNVGDYKLLRDPVEDALAGGAVPDDEGRVTLEPENVWLISYWGDDGRGMAKLGRLRSVKADVKTMAISDAETDQVLYFISGDVPEQAGVLYLLSDGAFRKTGLEGSRVRKTEYGILYALPENDVIRFDSLTADLFLK